MKKLNKKDVARLMVKANEERGIKTSIKEQLGFIEVLGDVFFEVLSEGDVEIAIQGFLKATCTVRPEHTERNPKTQETKVVPAGKKKASIRFTDTFKNDINA